MQEKACGATVAIGVELFVVAGLALVGVTLHYVLSTLSQSSSVSGFL